MAPSTYPGIDYGLGRANRDASTGIHYGVICQHSISGYALADIEPDYGDPTCPKCGGTVIDSTDPSVTEKEWPTIHGCADYACTACEVFIESGACFGDEPIGLTYERDGYSIVGCLDCDLMILASPFYTSAQFCSPCVPGAGNLDTPCDDGPKTYALGHDWFEEGKAPYRVFRVSDGSEVLPNG